jgi:hypothetical protein
MHEIITEEDDDDHVLEATFRELDTNEDGELSLLDVEEGFMKLRMHASIINQNILESGSGNSPNQDQDQKCIDLELQLVQVDDSTDFIDLKKFKEIARRVPRIQGQRLQWVKSFNLDGRLAALLSVGKLFDQLSGIREMEEEKIKDVTKQFGEEVEGLLIEGWKRLQVESDQKAGCGQVETAMNKFTGKVGSFGDVGMFYEGLETQIGMLDPLILKGIFRENVLGPDSEKRRISPNYKIVNSDKLEYARLLGHPDEYPESKEDDTDRGLEHIPVYLMEVAKGFHKGVRGPTETELKDLKPVLEKLRECYTKTCRQTDDVFPGDIGYSQKSLEVEFEAESREKAQSFLRSVEKKLDDLNLEIASLVQIDPDPDEADSVFPTDCKLTAFWPVVCQASAEFEKWIKTHSAVNFFNRMTYIYCDEPKLDTEAKIGKLRQLLMGLGDSQLLQVCDWLSESAQLSKESRVESVLNQVRESMQPGKTRMITFMQGRKRLSLKELMAVKEVREAELRVEEAMQAYQYTGPLYQVSQSQIFHRCLTDFA